MTPDPTLRRHTPLLDKLRRRIHQSGPLTVAEYMDACLYDSEFGYYTTSAALGRDGDFITAPEISQVFGELIGLWSVAVWQQMGAPDRIQLVELGGGRGTLMADALRATQRITPFFDALTVVMIESHSGLRAQQAATLKDHGQRISWPDHIDALAPVATIVIANEFVDCMPIDQYIAAPDQDPRWHCRLIGLDDQDQLQFLTQPPDTSLPDALSAFDADAKSPKSGALAELRNLDNSILAGLNSFSTTRETGAPPFAGLFIDYGHAETLPGDTLQAVRRHCYEHALTSPGEADLTANVDFARFASAMQRFGFSVDGPATQAAFLSSLGAVERANALMAHNPEAAMDIETALARLMSPSGMGGQFHVLGVRTPSLAPLPGLPS